jgi:thymidylate synthase (FAD)
VDVTYLDHMGTDLSVVNAARVSFGKRVQEFRPDKDARLLNYLARHKHELPFAHPHVSFHFKAPIFVARQLAKHQVGFVWSEISRRYVKDTPELYWPDAFRKGADDIKQGSTNEVWEDRHSIIDRIDSVTRCLIWDYERLVQEGCCAEQARMILPQNMYTEWHWTGSLLGWARVWGLRVKPDAQRETREVVEQIGPKMAELFPYSWKALTNG